MKLYEVPRYTKVRVIGEQSFEVFFDHIDGMYSYCTDNEGNAVHLAAWTEVEIVE